jgi:hypothetical protein
MQSLARAAPMGPEVSVCLGAAGRGPEQVPVSAVAFGTPFACNAWWARACRPVARSKSQRPKLVMAKGAKLRVALRGV